MDRLWTVLPKEDDSALQRKDTLTHVMPWKKLEGIVISKIKNSKKTKWGW